MPRLKAPQRREQLIEVATKLFARNGYEATTTAAIALAAGVTEPILYRHFDSKQELFVAIVRAVSQQTMNHWQELMAGVDDPSERIRRISKEFPAHAKHLADAYHVLHGALATPPLDERGNPQRKVMAVMKEHYAQIEEFFAKLIRDGQKAGMFRKDLDPKVPAWQLIMTGIGYAMLALNLSQFDDAWVREAIDTTLRGLRA
jgi:AcrR family transcriptional regulator